MAFEPRKKCQNSNPLPSCLSPDSGSTLAKSLAPSWPSLACQIVAVLLDFFFFFLDFLPRKGSRLAVCEIWARATTCRATGRFSSQNLRLSRKCCTLWKSGCAWLLGWPVKALFSPPQSSSLLSFLLHLSLSFSSHTSIGVHPIAESQSGVISGSFRLDAHPSTRNENGGRFLDMARRRFLFGQHERWHGRQLRGHRRCRCDRSGSSRTAPDRADGGDDAGLDARARRWPCARGWQRTKTIWRRG